MSDLPTDHSVGLLAVNRAGPLESMEARVTVVREREIPRSFRPAVVFDLYSSDRGRAKCKVYAAREGWSDVNGRIHRPRPPLKRQAPERAANTTGAHGDEVQTEFART